MKIGFTWNSSDSDAPAPEIETTPTVQLKEALSIIEEKYSDMYTETNYFAAILKRTLLSYAVEHGENSLTL